MLPKHFSIIWNSVDITLKRMIWIWKNRYACEGTLHNVHPRPRLNLDPQQHIKVFHLHIPSLTHISTFLLARGLAPPGGILGCYRKMQIDAFLDSEPRIDQGSAVSYSAISNSLQRFFITSRWKFCCMPRCIEFIYLFIYFCTAFEWLPMRSNFMVLRSNFFSFWLISETWRFSFNNEK